MWWNDIQEIKEEMVRLNERFTEFLLSIEYKVEKILVYTQQKSETCYNFNSIESRLETIVSDAVVDAFDDDDEYSSLNRIHDKLNSLINDADKQKAVLLAEKSLEKFEDYMKNVDKLNSLINEFKGCVTLARAALVERKQLDEEVKEMKNVSQIAQEIYKAMINFIKASKDIKQEAHFKIDAIYKTLCEKEDKKPRKKRTTKKDYQDS